MATIERKIYKLHFTTPLHLGDVRDDYGISLKTIASDTLYAALISCLAKLGKIIPNDGDLGCTISSLFPFYQKNKESETVLFFPKPMKMSLPDSNSNKVVEERKKVKKVAWLDVKFFSKMLCGEQLFVDNIIDKLDGEFLTDKEINRNFIVSQVLPRVKISRDGQEDAVHFYMDRIMFQDYSGLFFIADGDTSLLDKALQLLQHEGIGTDRNVGNGYFEYEESSLVIDVPDNSDYAMALSSFIPESREQLQTMLNSNDVAYDFQRRGGWITTPPHNTLRKNVIYAFTAASVFKMQCNKMITKGKVSVDLKPDINWDEKLDHPVWRCGRALFIPITIETKTI